jgi:hypothetical protein
VEAVVHVATLRVRQGAPSKVRAELAISSSWSESHYSRHHGCVSLSTPRLLCAPHPNSPNHTHFFFPIHRWQPACVSPVNRWQRRYVPYGDLRNVLKTAREKNIKLRVDEMLVIFRQLASGCEHIASCRIVHMDLAARNVLLGEGNTVK